MELMRAPSLIADNLHKVQDRMNQAAQSVGKNLDDIHLVVVTKTHPINVVEMVIEVGARYIGESYVEEGIPKIQALSGRSGVEWHMIGHVQSRKASLLCEHFDYLHSLDSVKLAYRIDRFASQMGRILPVLIECNVSGEATKYGWSAWREDAWPELMYDFGKILQLPNLKVKGLMTIAPYFDNAEEARPYFRRLRLLREFLVDHYPNSQWTELSMGMSGDFEVAIQEGATWIRVGQAILGPRNP